MLQFHQKRNKARRRLGAIADFRQVSYFLLHLRYNLLKDEILTFDSFFRSIRSFAATLGPAGGRRGYAGITGHVSNGLAWYMNGFLIPELWLRRGLTYAIKVSC